MDHPDEDARLEPMNDDSKDPLAEAAKEPARIRYGGAGLFLIAAVAGIITIRACKESGKKSPPPVPSAIKTQQPAP